ncbi:class I SAM-dependent methyltransferase [Baekduia sp.]|jgi:SAM-dependent methyltransferase|uniref:class I SAM-dependent methyltransferase n=1 Tax=Baekduia sp. TaxID=2600305 RepID=UPI002E0673C3|nr:methyltransferase domain-containing protein [Baekduia sp.]
MPALRDALARTTDPHQFDLRPTGPGAVLDIGCGSAKFPGAIGLDISGDTDADVVHDLDVFPYPIEDASFDQILMQDVIEHVAQPIRVFEELHRIARPGARIQLRTPHFSSVLAYGDPTHRHYFSTVAIRSLGEPRFAHYTDVRFREIHVTLDLWLPFRLTGIAALANRYQLPYESYFAFRFPTMNIRAEFEVVK